MMTKEEPKLLSEESYEEKSRKFKEIKTQIIQIFPLLYEKVIIEKSKYGVMEDLNKYVIYPLLEKYDRMKLVQFAAYHNLIGSTPPKGLPFDFPDGKIEKFVKEKLTEFQQALNSQNIKR